MNMQTTKLYIKDWLAIHPYTRQLATDKYFVDLSNHLYNVCPLTDIPPILKKKLCLYSAAYLEDIISELGLWKAFTIRHKELYGTTLPFYAISAENLNEEIKEEDIRFILWNTLAKAPYKHPYASPLAPAIKETARLFFQLLDEAYETAPANEVLSNYFSSFKEQREADSKLKWLFGHTYLTEPSVQEYIDQITDEDRFIIPCGPLALFLHEWINLLTPNHTDSWRQVKGLYPPPSHASEELKEKNRHTYQLFTQGTSGAPIVYLQGYEALRRFLTTILQWPDDENYTLPQMKAHKNFILMAHPEKGILLANDICECISDPLNPMYNPKTARQEAFNLLTVPTKCPPDLREYLLDHHYLPDAQFPTWGERELVQKNADFLARHTLLYYYRGD